MSRRDGTRHRSLTEGLECEPLLAVPVALALLALACFVIAAAQDAAAEAATHYWVGASTFFVAAHCLFALVYDSPRRHAARVARGCPHIRPRHRADAPPHGDRGTARSVDGAASRRTIRR